MRMNITHEHQFSVIVYSAADEGCRRSHRRAGSSTNTVSVSTCMQRHAG